MSELLLYVYNVMSILEKFSCCCGRDSNEKKSLLKYPMIVECSICHRKLKKGSMYKRYITRDLIFCSKACYSYWSHREFLKKH